MVRSCSDALADGDRIVSTKTMFRIVVAVVFAFGLFSLLTAVIPPIDARRSAFEMAIGLTYLWLAVRLYRGSDVARIILAAIFAISLVVLCYVALFSASVIAQAPWLAGAFMLGAAIYIPLLWALVWSKSFRAELARARNGD